MARFEQVEAYITCPYCGENISVLVDTSIEAQDYIEDCEVCCRPLALSAVLVGDAVEVTARRSDD
ncbi:MAG: CPXCG motif-containing cysteine-rich protein [Gammaproteobacteria bacterium]|nr:CPXCG motif-containing cysteine-rich protein [Gammaproteobacteria bacterium]MCP5199431.1 CPXCG motif-containing cysteine-rich protein [Gammaproteobacteria bacterium]